MVLLNPAGLLALALIPVLIVLYLLRLRRKSLKVSSLLPWRTVIEQSRRRSLFHKFRNPLSFVFQLLILLLITFALARPEFSGHAREGAATVILLDTSIRMQADEAGTRRFEKARRGVEALLRRAHRDNQIALVAFDSAPHVLAPFTPDERALLKGLASARVTDCAPDFVSALQLARDLLASRAGTRRIVAVTDLPLPPPSEFAGADGLEISRLEVGPPISNVAITGFSVRPLAANPLECEALVEISNFSAQGWKGNLELRLDDTVIDVRKISLEPGAVHKEILSGIALDVPRLFVRGWVVASIESNDALAGDNRAFAVVPTAPKRRVLLVSRGNWFLQNLLEADARTEYELLSPENFRPDAARSFAAVIFDSELPRGIDLAGLPAGNYIFLGVAPFRPEEKVGRRGVRVLAPDLPDVESVVITSSDDQHPLLRGISLAELRILRARAFDQTRKQSAWQFDVVASAGDAPVLLAGRRPNGTGGDLQKCVVLAFGIAESDLPLRVAFPLFFNNALQWISGEDSPFINSVLPGETIALQPGESLWTTPFAEPEKVPERVNADQIERVAYRPLAKGFYRRDVRGQASWVAVSGASKASSDFLSQGENESARRNDGDAMRRAIAAPRSWPELLMIWPPWVGLAVAAVFLLILEWWLFHERKVE